MKLVYVLIYDPEETQGIIGIYTSGKKLTDATANMQLSYRRLCLVKTIPLDTWRGDVRGHDHQGTMLNEFLATPIAQDDGE